MTTSDSERQALGQCPGHQSAPMTIRDLVAIPYLGTRLHAGANGAERVVTWAHSSEIATPWEWLEPGDLLMTIGLGLPAEPEAQAEYIEKLAASGISGIAFAEELAPPLSEALIDAAERYALPVLYTTWNVPFGQISRAVAAANYGSQQGKLVKVARIYDRVLNAVSTQSKPLDLFRQLAAETRCEIYVCTNSGHAAFGQGGAPPEHVRTAFLAALEQHEGRLPGFLRLALGDESLVIVPIPTRIPSSLLAIPRGETPPFAILQHVATVAALELERMWLDLAEQRRLGTETLAQLMHGRLIQGTAGALQRLQIAGKPMIMFALNHDDPRVFHDFHYVLADCSIPNLLLNTGEMLFALVPAEGGTSRDVCELLPAGARAGISDTFTDPTQAPTAAEQAKWALGSTTAGRPIARHGEDAPLFGARSRAEATAIVHQVLGSVLEYDKNNETELVYSLRVFLECNRSWKDAAARLFVHKQTLIYRMRRVEELTGRRLSETADVVDLWLALRAHEIVGAR